VNVRRGVPPETPGFDYPVWGDSSKKLFRALQLPRPIMKVTESAGHDIGCRSVLVGGPKVSTRRNCSELAGRSSRGMKGRVRECGSLGRSGAGSGYEGARIRGYIQQRTYSRIFTDTGTEGIGCSVLGTFRSLTGVAWTRRTDLQKKGGLRNPLHFNFMLYADHLKSLTGRGDLRFKLFH